MEIIRGPRQLGLGEEVVTIKIPEKVIKLVPEGTFITFHDSSDNSRESFEGKLLKDEYLEKIEKEKRYDHPAYATTKKTTVTKMVGNGYWTKTDLFEGQWIGVQKTKGKRIKKAVVIVSTSLF